MARISGSSAEYLVSEPPLIQLADSQCGKLLQIGDFKFVECNPHPQHAEAHRHHLVLLLGETILVDILLASSSSSCGILVAYDKITNKYTHTHPMTVNKAGSVENPTRTVRHLRIGTNWSYVLGPDSGEIYGPPPSHLHTPHLPPPTSKVRLSIAY